MTTPEERAATVEAALAEALARVGVLEALVKDAVHQIPSEPQPVRRRWADWLLRARAELRGPGG